MAERDLRARERSASTAPSRSDDLTLEIADGEFMVLVGPSGCGKTHRAADARRARGASARAGS